MTVCCADVSVADNILLVLGDGVRRLNCPPVRADDPYSMIFSGRGFFMVNRPFRNHRCGAHFEAKSYALSTKARLKEPAETTREDMRAARLRLKQEEESTELEVMRLKQKASERAAISCLSEWPCGVWAWEPRGRSCGR
jgi:hypothetical protein